jgi:acetyl-CoA carboxylase biotin carboxyl carrier protein
MNEADDRAELERFASEDLPGLVRVVTGSRVRELDIHDGDVTVHIKRGDAVIDTAPDDVLGEKGDLDAIPLHVVTAPLVGIFHRSRREGGDPLVRPGDHVSAGQTVGIIDSLQVPTEVEADQAGTVRAIVVEDGQPVAYGDALIEIEPDSTPE